MEFLDQWYQIVSRIFTRYTMVAGIAFVLFYLVLRYTGWFVKIQEKFPGSKDYRREVFYSLTSIIIFGLVVLFILAIPRAYTRFYPDIEDFGWGYYMLSFVLMTLLHDTYFYWTHRLMHHPRLFRWFHLVHHKSTNPSPWAAYAFHPLEAIVEAGIYIIIVFTIPVHKSALGVFFLFSIIYNVYGHLGYELYPKGFDRHWLGKWINTSVNHNLHHKYFTGSYGLYFTFWDRVMRTLHRRYNDSFESVTVRQREARRRDRSQALD